MSDPFRIVDLRSRIMKSAALILLVGLMGVIGYLQFGTVITGGRIVEAEVIRIGTAPTGGVAGANVPVLTVRMPDRSIRQLNATWADVRDCRAGRSISIRQQGAALLVGRPGCDTND
jgi:hypothetical protein